MNSACTEHGGHGLRPGKKILASQAFKKNPCGQAAF